MPIPSTLPISYNQITGEFGGASLRTAANNAGLPAGAVSFSSFAGLSPNEGSGTFTAGIGSGGVGFSTIYSKYGTWNDAYMPGSRALQACYNSQTSITIRCQSFGNANRDLTFSTLRINGVTLNRSDAGFTYNPPFVQWSWLGLVPANTLVDGVTYEPIWATA